MRELTDESIPAAHVAFALSQPRGSGGGGGLVMAMLVVLLETEEGEVALGSHAVSDLARAGVTSVALLGDERTICIVVEGWAFDPARSARVVLRAISAARRSIRVLRPVMHTSVEGVPATVEMNKSGS